MQNIDFYEGKALRSSMPAFERIDPEYFAGNTKVSSKEFEKSRKKTSRALFLFIAVNIITFTLGIVTGLKFAGGGEKVIVDPQTYQTVSDIGRKVTAMIKEPAIHTNTPANQVYPKEKFPFVIQIGSGHSSETAKNIAGILSAKGHTVILSQKGENYEVYSGPFQTMEEAERTLETIKGYDDTAIGTNAGVLSR